MSVVLETLLSGRSELAALPFAALMGGIHLPIGAVEGFVTAAVLGYVLKIRPELSTQALGTTPGRAASRGIGPVLTSFGVAALLAGCLFVWFGSSRPDGLEWSIARVAGEDGLERPRQGLPGTLAKIQRSTAVFPEYAPAAPASGRRPESDERGWPGVDAGRSAAGFVGAILTLAVAGIIAFLLTRRRKRAGAPA